MNFKDLNKQQRIQMVSLIGAVISLLHEHEFACHAINHMERFFYDQYDPVVIPTLRSEVLERIDGNVSYMILLVHKGVITDDELLSLPNSERVKHRTLWLQGMIEEVQQLNQEEGNN